MNRAIALVSYFMFFMLTIHSQTNDNASMTWEDFVNIMSDNTDDESIPDTELFEELYDIHKHPLNLNSVSAEELHLLPFLSEDDIKNILFYIEKHHPLMSTGELMFIPSLDYQKRLMTQLFCYAGEYKKKDYSIKKIFKYSQNELTLRTDFPFYKKAGYQDVSDSILSKNPNKVYQGNSLHHSLRYTFSSQNHFFAGFQMEKDPGERYVDHFAGYAMIKNIGHIHTAILGNYKVAFGHGLVINNGSSFGKAMKLSSMDVIDKGISRHSSTSESGYLTGGAATLIFGKVKTSAFISYQKADGTFNSDSSGISSLKTDGLHRTLLEISKKNNISITDFGANVHLDLNNIQLSITSAHTHINVPLAPKYNTPSTYYRYYNPQGKDFTSTSLSYSYRGKHFLFSGETAINEKFAIATLEQLQWSQSSFNTFTLIYRYYQAKYNAIRSHSFGENSKINNEQGLYLGWYSAITSKLSLQAYIDAMYFPWLKYQVYGSSKGFESLLQGTYTISPKHNLSLRYKIKSKQRDSKQEDNTILKYKTSQNIRLQYNFIPSTYISFKTTLNNTYISFAKTKNSGFAFTETIRYIPNSKLKIDFSGTYFNTDSYDARIYNYEPSLLYTFAMSSYYYKGVKSAIIGTYSPLSNLHITFKFSSTNYFDRDNIGTALEQINNKHHEDLQLQLRYKF